MKVANLEAALRRKYGDPAEVRQYSSIASQGLSLFEEKLVRQSFAPGQRVLDIGCGGGREAVPMAQYGLRVVGMDLIPAMVLAARCYGVENGQAISFLVGNVAELPFRDASFDGVAMLGQVLTFIPGRDKRIDALRSAWRALRPGGALAMTTHNRHYRWQCRLYFFVVNRVRRLARRLGYDSELGDNDRWTARISAARSRHPVCFHMYDLDEAVADLQAAGFEVVAAKGHAEFETGRADPALRTKDCLLGFIARRPGG